MFIENSSRTKEAASRVAGGFIAFKLLVQMYALSLQRHLDSEEPFVDHMIQMNIMSDVEIEPAAHTAQCQSA